MQLVIGRYAVFWASYFVRAQKYAPGADPKLSTVVGVSFRDIAETYHLMLQIGLAGKRLYWAVNRVPNFDSPVCFKR